MSGSYVAWSGYVGGGSREIFMHDGASVKRLTDNIYDDRNADVSGGQVVWEGHDGNDYEIFTAFLAPTTLYVDANATGADDGSSWNDAYNYLQDALADPYLAPGDEIWVAEGTYIPDTNSADPNGSGDQGATFWLINGVAIYGGFPVGGGSWNQRDSIFYETVLSGDLDGNDVGDLDDPSRYDNTSRVVTGSGTDETAVIDGFVITAGRGFSGGGGIYNFYGSPSVVNCAFWRNTSTGKAPGGAAMHNVQSSPTVTNCEFTCNRAYGGPMSGSGGIYNRDSSNPKVTNCVFSGNSGVKGGGMYNDSSNPVITNCTFSGNASRSYEGGGIYNEWDGDPNLTNCILWGNTGSGGTEESAQIYYSPNSAPDINYTCIKGWTGALGGTGNKRRFR
jgi:hypothetical protein